MKSVTAVLPNYNNEAFIARTLDSLIKQRLRNIEIIVIDDASIDNSKDIISYYVRTSKRIKSLFLKERKGAAYCRNLGNSMASSPLIMVCDSGDINHIARANDAYNFLKKRADVDIYSTTCIETNILDENVHINFPRIFNDKEKPSLFHPTVTYRKSVTERIKYREGNFATDQYEAFFFEAYRAGFSFWFTLEAMVKKLRHSHESDINERYEQRKKNYEEFGIYA